MKKTNLAGKDKILIGFIIFIFVALAAWSAFWGVKGLFFSHKHSMDDLFAYSISGDSYEGEIKYVSNQRHSLIRYIRYRWAGTEYFYIIYSEDKSQAMLVRASKNWNEKFGNDTINQVSVQSDGMVKELRYKTKQELSNTFSDLENDGIQISHTYYLDLLAKRVCYVELFAGISLLILVIYFYLIIRKALYGTSKPIFKPLLMFMLVWMVLTFVAFFYLRNLT